MLIYMHICILYWIKRHVILSEYLLLNIELINEIYINAIFNTDAYMCFQLHNPVLVYLENLLGGNIKASVKQ